MLSFPVLWESNVKPLTVILQCRLLPVTVFIEMQDCNLQSKKTRYFWFCFVFHLMWHKFRVFSFVFATWNSHICNQGYCSLHYDVMIMIIMWLRIHTCLSFHGLKRPAFLQQSGCRQKGRPPEKMWHVVQKFALYLSRGTPSSAALWDFHRVVYLQK